MDELKKVIPFLGFDLIGLSKVSYLEGVDPNLSDDPQDSCSVCQPGCLACKPGCSAGGR